MQCDSIYVILSLFLQSQRLNPMNYSESNLVHPMSVIDRINSTSSSNESVCSTSSLNQSYTRQPPTLTTKSTIGTQQVPQTIQNYLDINNKTNNYTGRDDSSQNFMPKKTQRTKDTFSRQRYQSPRDNVYVF